ncbi:MAG: HYR domain-containing protein [Planctomycetota bacterium]
MDTPKAKILVTILLAFALAGMARAGAPIVTLNPDDDCIGIGNPIVVTVDLTNSGVLIVAGQFFMEYDPSLDFVSIESTTAPFTSVLSQTIDEVLHTIDYAVGVPPGGSGVTAGTFATITFQPNTEVCDQANLVSFRPHEPPTQLSDDSGGDIQPSLNSLPSITLGDGPEIANVPPDITVECNAIPPAPLTLPADDNCNPPTVTEATIESEVRADGPCEHDYTLTRTWATGTDLCGLSGIATQEINVEDSTVPDVTCPPDIFVPCGVSVAPSNTGNATTTDNCDVSPSLTFSDDDVPGACTSDVVITRSWSSQDDCGNVGVCDQTITAVTGPMPSLNLAADDTCYMAGEPVVVTVNLVDSQVPIVSSKFYLNYNASLDFIDMQSIAAPFTDVLLEDVDEGARTIEYEVGVPFATGGAPSGTLAVIVFHAIDEVCVNSNGLVAFQDNSPPSALSSDDGSTYLPFLNDLPDVTFDQTDSVVNNLLILGGPVDESCERVVTFSATVTDNCCVDVADVSVDLQLVSAGNATLSSLSINKVQIDGQAVSVFGEVTVSDITSCPAIVEVNVGVTDCCGNIAAPTIAQANINDTAPPEMNCPSDISVGLDAGACGTAAVSYSPTATDNCVASPEVLCDIPSGSDFSVGATTVTCEASDGCATSQCQFDVTVNPVNELAVEIELGGGVSVPTPFTRCITFEFWDCTNEDPLAVASRDMLFTNGMASAVLDVPCGAYSCVTASDGLHTLRRTDSDDFGIFDAQYVADFTDKTGIGGNDDSLISGNLNDDNVIDILDFGVFASQWLFDYGIGGSPCGAPFPHADVNGDGVVNNAELTFIQINFLEEREANCCTATTASADASEPVTSISVKELYRTGRADLAAGDLNSDGWLDMEDIQAFMMGARPQPQRTPARHGNLHKSLRGNE